MTALDQNIEDEILAWDNETRDLSEDELEPAWGTGTAIGIGRPPEATRKAGLVLPPALDLDEFLDTPEPDYDWLVDLLIERGDRIIWTGPEGGGKTTLLRQLVTQLSAGIHPFTLAAIPPIRALVVDCENSPRQTRRAMKPLRAAAGAAYVVGNVRIIAVGGALAVADPAIEAQLAEVIRTHEIDLISIGPLYKMNQGDPVKEEPAAALSNTLDRLRLIRGSALLIEAHTPYAEGSRSKRPLRPYGASLWSRWPEFGMYLDPQGAITHWRGQRDERSWPKALIRSTPWPWAAAPDQPLPAGQWDGPSHCMDAIRAMYDAEPGLELSKNKVIERLRAGGHAFRASTMRDALDRLAGAGEMTVRSGAHGAQIFRLADPEQEPDELF